MMRYTTLFFDLDDTLVDTVRNNKEALRDVYEEYGLGSYFPAFDDFYNKFRDINTHLWELYAHGKITKDYLRETRFRKTLEGVEVLTTEKSLQMNDVFLDRANTKKNVIEGGKDILEYLYPKYRMFILSNGFQEVQSHKMNNARLNPYFQKVILSDHIGKNKPHPAIFDYALKEAGVDRAETVMIGDNIGTDIIGARDSGIDQIWFNPNNQPDNEDVNPTYTIARLDELKAIL